MYFIRNNFKPKMTFTQDVPEIMGELEDLFIFKVVHVI